MNESDLKPWQRAILWPKLRFIFPTLAALYLNRVYLSHELKAPKLDSTPWAREQARLLLGRSEERLRGIEAKGPGLATVCAVIAAAVIAALLEGWDDATLLGRVLLGLASWYAAFSLLTPIYLVGPQPRHTVDAARVGVASMMPSPEDYIAREEVVASQHNVRRNQRLGNLQDAARNELGAAIAVLVVWALLGPVTGLLVRDQPAEERSCCPPAATAAPSSTPVP